MKGIFGCVGVGVLLSACSLFTPANLPKTEETAKDIACVIEHAFLDDPSLNAVCNLLTAAQQAAGKQLAAAHRAGVSKALAAHRASLCAPDAGASADGGAP